LKNPILVGVLLISILLNAAGIVFFILFLTEHAHSKSLRKQKASVERTLGVFTSGSRIAEAINSETTGKSTFVSLLDGSMDYYAFQAPQFLPGSLDYTLVVYLHGMGSNYLEPFVAQPDQSQSIASVLSRDNPRLGILSCNYRGKSSWGNDFAISDIVQNIEEVMQKYPFKKIVLMGTSMGGCVALNLAATAPDDIKKKLAGVVAMEAGGDLSELVRRTGEQQIPLSMFAAFGGGIDQIPDLYRKKSFLTNIDSLPRNARVYLLSCRSDRIIPPDFQQAIMAGLNQRSIASQLVEIDGDHQSIAPDYYSKGVKYVLGQNVF
jgi:pimeloyl-ACP methyl ester carboxylesterase